jgi:hypothetical protein
MPTPEETQKTLLNFKKSLGIKKTDDIARISKIIKHFYTFLIVYPILVIFLLVCFKPDIICHSSLLDDIQIDENNNIEYNRHKYNKRKKISLLKLLLWFIIFQIPLFLYYLFITDYD